jgi:predicted ATPase
MDLEGFRAGIGERRRIVGRSQAELAGELGLHPDALRHKLRGDGRHRLTRDEIRGIVKALAQWDAFSARSEVEGLLGLGGLAAGAFTDAEWCSAPLAQLERDRPRPPAGLGTPPRPAPPAPRIRPLPAPATRLVGRGREVEEVAELLTGDARLVTLTGVGGTGKTRLAIEIASRLGRALPDGAVFADLSTVRDPDLVPPAVAAALGIKEQAGGPIEDALVDRLADKELLLVLDNLEQVLLAAPFVGELLSSCPDLRVLATSRVPLHLYGEHEYRVPPLGLPSNEDPKRVLQSEAVALFINRARAARPGFEPRGDDLRAVAEICSRLDGLPLAIELAAARARLFSPRVLLDRLGSRLGTLTGGARDLPERQRTLRAALDWSHDLLQPEERRAFARLGGFAGGFDAAAAEAVLEHREGDPLDALCALSEHGLLEVGDGEKGEPRFRMLETVREYALARLAEDGGLGEVRARHAGYYLALAEGAARRVGESARERGWWEPLEVERDNLRAVLSWASEAGDSGERAEMGLRLGAALYWFWVLRGYPSEGLGRLEAVLDASAGGSEPGLRQSRARALLAAGDLAVRLDEPQRALPRYAEAIELFRAMGDRAGEARALHGTGAALLEGGDEAGAERPVREALSLFRALGDTEGESLALRFLGNLAERRGDAAGAVALVEELLSVCRDAGDAHGIATVTKDIGARLRDQGELGRATRLLEESIALAREIGDDGVLGRALHELGGAALLGGDYGRAMALQEESLALSRREGHKLFEAQSLTILGHAARGLGDPGRATRSFQESLALFRELEQPWGIKLSLAGLATVAAGSGDAVRATRLLGAVAASKEGPPVIPAHRAEYERSVAAARKVLGEAAWETAWAEGRRMPLDDAVGYALGGITGSRAVG